MYSSAPSKPYVFRRPQAFGLRFVFYSLVAISLIFVDTTLQRADMIRRGLTVALTPFHYLVSGPTHFFDVMTSSFTSHQKLVNENRNLRMQQLFLESQLQRFRALEKENEQLRELLLASSHLEGKVLNARLLAVAPDPYLSEIMINKGGRDKVFVGQPVLDSHGVMGQVIRVGPYSSRVLLLTDNRSQIPVEVHRNGLRGIVAGGGHKQMQLLHIPDTADIRVGDQLYTSGLGQRFPVGYPVAEVTAVKHSPEKKFAEVALKPIALVHQSREVILIWPSNDKTKING